MSDKVGTIGISDYAQVKNPLFYPLRGEHIRDYPASKVLSYFFSAWHREARETLQNLCIN
jgi:hypothetical protein